MRRAYVNLKLLEHKVINFELKSTVLGTVDQLHPIGMPFNLPPIILINVIIESASKIRILMHTICISSRGRKYTATY